MIEYMLPDFIIGQLPYTTLLELQKIAPHMLYPNQGISFIYGCVPNAIWNGGSILLHQRIYHKPEVKEYIDYINNTLNLPIAWTFTNPLIGEKECYDSYCNMLAELGHNGKNYILVSSPILEKYLREHYPNYKYCRSIIVATNEKEAPLIYDNPDYEFSVLQRAYNNDFEYLKSIPEEYRHKVEILTTDRCPPNCPRIYTHYVAFANAQIKYDYKYPGIPCTQEQYAEGNPLVITKQMIDEIYVPLGYTHFKLSGRTNLDVIIDNICEYFVLPEYQELVRDMMREEFLNKKKEGV